MVELVLVKSDGQGPGSGQDPDGRVGTCDGQDPGSGKDPGCGGIVCCQRCAGKLYWWWYWSWGLIVVMTVVVMVVVVIIVLSPGGRSGHCGGGGGHYTDRDGRCGGHCDSVSCCGGVWL